MSKGFRLAFFGLLFLFVFSFNPFLAFSAEIDGQARFLDDQFGIIEFNPSNGGAELTQSELTGFIWGDNVGWINLSPSNGGVENDGNGNLSGYAWGSNTGWINFSPSNGGVSVDDGEFFGYAWGQNHGWIVFNCQTDNTCSNYNHKVSVDSQIPVSSPTTPRPPTSGGGADESDPDDSGEDEISEEEPIIEDDPIDPDPEEGADPDEDVTPPEEDIVDPEDSLDPEEDIDSDEEGEETTEPEDENGAQDPDQTTPSPDSSPAFGVMSYLAGVFNNGFALIEAGAEAIFTDPAGRATTDAFSVVGAISGLSIVAASLFANPLSFSEIFLLPFRVWGLILSFLGLRKRHRSWGVVYDSITKQPLDPAYVVLFDQNGKQISESITDLDGRYGFLVEPGVYKLSAAKTNYVFPSEKIKDKTEDEMYSNLYFGGTVSVKNEGEVIRKNIPMDPERFDWNEFAKREQKLMKFYSKKDAFVAKLLDWIFGLGFVVASFALFFAPEPYNLAIFFLYVIMLFLRIMGLKPKAFGYLKDSSSNPLSFALIRVYTESGNEVKKTVVNKKGQYYILIAKGKYYLTIEKKENDGNYVKVYTSDPIDVSKGVINQNFTV